MDHANTRPRRWYRFRPGMDWWEHLWKSLILRDHGEWRDPLRAVVPSGGLAIDVGAHGGMFTRMLSAMVGPDGMVVAVEPSGHARSVLGPSLFLHRVRNTVVVACALGAANDLAVLRTPIKRLGAMGWGLANLSPAVQQQRDTIDEPVAVLTLDSLVRGLELPRIDFIKIDIEGHEAAFVAGAVETLRRFRPAMLMEMSATRMTLAGASLEVLWARLVDEFGYVPHELRDGSLHRLHAPPTGKPNVLWLADNQETRP